MKKQTLAWFVLSILLIWTTACKKDDSPNAPNPPSIALAKDTIITVQGSVFTMEAKLTDQVGLRSFTLQYDDWFLRNTITLKDSGYPKEYQLLYKFRMPESASNTVHKIRLTTTNVGGKETSTDIAVMLDTDYPKLYLTESKDESKLTSDLFGVPMLIDKTGPYAYRAVYYSASPNSTVWFTPSKTDLEQTLYGIDPSSAGKLTADPATAAAIVLPSVGYYAIELNSLNLNYSVEALPEPDPAGAFSQVAIAGQGFYDYPAMAWQNALPNIILLDKDPVNPYLFTKTVKLGTPPGQTYTDAAFIFTTNNGWTDFWRFDNGPSPEYTVPNNGANGGNFPITSTPVTYKVTFDTYINRCKFEKQ